MCARHRSSKDTRRLMSSSDSSHTSSRSLRSNSNTLSLLRLDDKGSKRAQWTVEETSELLQFLHAHKHQSGDSNFKATTFSQAANHINLKFPLAKGAIKTGKACSSRWSKVKSDYYAILHLKNTSGLHYSDSDGVPMTPELEPIWSVYVKHHPEARRFANKGFPHFYELQLLVSGTSKNRNKYRPTDNSTGTSAPGMIISSSSSSSSCLPHGFPASTAFMLNAAASTSGSPRHSDFPTSPTFTLPATVYPPSSVTFSPSIVAPSFPPYQGGTSYLPVHAHSTSQALPPPGHSESYALPLTVNNLATPSFQAPSYSPDMTNNSIHSSHHRDPPFPSDTSNRLSPHPPSFSPLYPLAPPTQSKSFGPFALDPNSLPPSAPLSCITPSSMSASGSSAVTSVSRNKRKKPSSSMDSASVITSASHGKRKQPASNADSGSSSKRARPVSASVQAQLQGGAAMDKMATLFSNTMASLVQSNDTGTVGSVKITAASTPAGPSASAAGSADLISRAATVVSNLPIDDNDKMLLADYMSDKNNENAVKFFITFQDNMRMKWVERKLNELKGAMSY